MLKCRRSHHLLTKKRQVFPAYCPRRSHWNSRTSARWPAIADAAAMAGLIRWVRPPRPCRPSKLRLEVEAQRSPGSSRSAFMARHIEHPASRHSKPAARKILSRPSDSACTFTRPEPGTTMAPTWDETLRPFFNSCSTIFAASRKSSMRPLVQEPEGAVDLDLAQQRAGLQIHIGERAVHALAL